MPRIARVLAALALVTCANERPNNLDLDLIHVLGEAKLRTDTVGGGQFVDTATFVLVDAENTARQGAYVTLGGTLSDADKQVRGSLKAQSLWVPAGESRTFALVDTERKARPEASSARIVVRGALVADPPLARVEQQKTFDDFGKIVVHGTLVSDAKRIGQVMVIASFKDAEGRPMTRPFAMYQIGPNQACSATPELEMSFRAPCFVQFVGPQGSKSATIYIGDVGY